MIPDENETVYAEDLPEDYADKVYSSTMNRRETPVKAMAKPAKAVPAVKPSKFTRIAPTIPEDKASDEEMENNRSYLSRGVGVDSGVNDAISAAKSANKGKYRGIKMNSGGSVSSASSRADGIAQRGKTRGKVC